MPYWYFEKEELKHTPSIQDGIDYETECRYRKEGARFIIDTGFKMKLRYNTVATGVVYFHRFYMFHSFKQFPRFVTACCCLFLAGKVEETPKKCRDIINTAKTLLNAQTFLTFGNDPKQEVMTLEKILLQTIKFDLQVEHPYSYLLKYAKCLKGDKQKLQEMVQMAWTFVNDSLCTTLSLQWEQEIIAIALIYLASKLIKFEIVDWDGRQPEHLRWWDMFVEDLTMDQLEDICHQVLDSYMSQSKTETLNPSSEGSPIPSQASPPMNIGSNVAEPVKASKIEMDSSIDYSPEKMQAQDDKLMQIASNSHYPSYPTNYPPPISYSPAFPPPNMSVPPPPSPSANAINHMMPSMHAGPVSSIRPPPSHTATGPSFSSYGFPGNGTYFAPGNPMPPPPVPCPYYPPQL